jgi:retron-type reverse transcriptase
LEKILQADNLNMAYKKVKSNEGTGGVDEMRVDKHLPFHRDNQKHLIQKLKDGKYESNPVRRVEIPKETKVISIAKVHSRRNDFKQICFHVARLHISLTFQKFKHT